MTHPLCIWARGVRGSAVSVVRSEYHCSLRLRFILISNKNKSQLPGKAAMLRCYDGKKGAQGSRGTHHQDREPRQNPSRTSCRARGHLKNRHYILSPWTVLRYNFPICRPLGTERPLEIMRILTVSLLFFLEILLICPLSHTLSPCIPFPQRPAAVAHKRLFSRLRPERREWIIYVLSCTTLIISRH